MIEDERKRREVRTIVAMGFILLASQLLAIYITPTFEEAEVQAFEEPDNPLNAIFYIAIILIFTLVILLIVKFKKQRLIQVIILAAVGLTMLYVFVPLLFKFIPYAIVLDSIAIGLPDTIGIFLAIILTYTLFRFPEWYVVDSVGIFVSAGAITIFGISLGILPVFILLIALAVYDAISVYRTKHMIDLADSVMELRLPILVVVPKKAEYSFLKQKRLKEQLDSGEEREAMFMGLGDIVIPSMLIISSIVFLDKVVTSLGITGNFLVGLCTMIGIIVGYSVLMLFVIKGMPQAGLPLLNSGAILGYMLSYYLIYQDLTFGFRLSW